MLRICQTKEQTDFIQVIDLMRKRCQLINVDVDRCRNKKQHFYRK